MRVTQRIFEACAPGGRVGEEGAVRAEPRWSSSVALRRRRLQCPRCEFSTRARKDTRHGGLGLEASGSRRLAAGDPLPAPTAALPAPRGARRERAVRAPPRRVHARLRVSGRVAGARVDKSAICRLLQGRLGHRRADHRARVRRRARSDRLCELFDIGVDEVSWKRQHNYLTLVADHRAGKIVWGTEGAGEKAADRFFAELDPDSPRAAAARRRSTRRPTRHDSPGRAAPPTSQTRRSPSAPAAGGDLARHGPRLRRRGALARAPG